MNYSPPGSPYVVSRRDDGCKIVEIYDFHIGDALVILLHLCRSFPVVITYPRFEDDSSEFQGGFLWVRERERTRLDEKMRQNPGITYEYVTTDLINGVESAFYRDKSVRAIGLEQVARAYFAKTAKEGAN